MAKKKNLKCAKNLMWKENKNPRVLPEDFFIYYIFYYIVFRKDCAHQDLNLEPTDYESVALTD